MSNSTKAKKLKELLKMIKDSSIEQGVYVRFKVYKKDRVVEENTGFTLQVKSTITKQVVRFIFREDESIRIVFRDRNPNQAKHIGSNFTIKLDCIVAADDNLQPYMGKVIDFIASESAYNKVVFNKIDTTPNLEELTEDNVWMQEVDTVTVTAQSKTKEVAMVFTSGATFTSSASIFEGCRMPLPGDYFFMNYLRNVQTLSKEKAIYHYAGLPELENV